MDHRLAPARPLPVMSRPGARRRTAAVAVGLTLLLGATACGSGAGEDGGVATEGTDPSGSGGASSTTAAEQAPGPSGAGGFRGTTADGAGVVVAVDDEGQVLVSWSAVSLCGVDEPAEEENDFDGFDAAGAMVDGELGAVSSILEEGTDGDYRTFTVEVTGRDDGAGGLTGTLVLEYTWVNGQMEQHDDDYEPASCRTEPVAWEAGRSDDPLLADTLLAFRAAAEDDVDAVTDRFAAGLPADVRHPIRGTTLVQNVLDGCEPGGSWEEGQRTVGPEGERRPFPSEAAEATAQALVTAGVPPCTVPD